MDDFYQKFEERYRGPREAIKERLRIYLPFVKPLQTRHPQPIALDLGCGRGEWLELLTEEGFDARGVDLDQGMLAACEAFGLNAQLGDAISILDMLPDECVSVVSAFHVVEHINFNTLMTMLKQALRVLVPGGILILETPNAENIVVGTLNFYLDPTHLKPIPPHLLSFSVEYCGFERIKTLRLQEPSALRNENFDVHLMDVLGGVSPDYSVVAQKKCNEDFSTLFDKAFTKEYGLTLNELTGRYEENMRTRVQQVAECSNQHWKKIESTLHRLEHAYQQTNERDSRIEHLSNELSERDTRVEELTQDAYRKDAEIAQFSRKTDELVEQVKISEQSAHHWWLEYDKLHIEMTHLRNTLAAVYESRSWRVTAPLRWLKTVCVHKFWRSIKVRMKIALSKLAVYVNRHPVLRCMALQIIHRIPGMRNRLVRSIDQAPMPPAQKRSFFKTRKKTEAAHKSNAPTKVQHLPPHAQRVYKTLRMELTRRSGEMH